MPRKKNLDKLLPKDSRKSTKKVGQVTATRELLDRLNVIDDLATKFFDTIDKKIEELTERIDNLESDFEQVIDAVAQFGKGGGSKPFIRKSSPKTKSVPSSPSTTANTPAPPAISSTPQVGSPPKLGGTPKIEFKQGPNAPKF